MPVATIIDMGVARPKAQGHAIIMTDTALMSPNTQLGFGPKNPQMKKVRTAIETTETTKYEETWSAILCIGALERWASATICITWESTVAEPTFSARMIKAPLAFIVAPINASPVLFVTGIGSPVNIDSSTELEPLTTTPSTGTFSPGRIRRISPTTTSFKSISSSIPSE